MTSFFNQVYQYHMEAVFFVKL